MSGIVELANSLLLGWMRAVFAWFWLMVSGRSGSDSWQWFLSHWKIWLGGLIIAGLVVDWLMWMIRWRPYRLLFAHFRRGAPAADASAQWDEGTGYYAPEEQSIDVNPADWDLTLGTLSEFGPDWADELAAGDDPVAYAAKPEEQLYYTEAYEEPLPAVPVEYPAYGQADEGYWEEEDNPAPEESTALYDAPFVELHHEAEQTMQYGRPTMWPGEFSYAEPENIYEPEVPEAPEPEAVPEPQEPQYYYPDEADEPPLRRFSYAPSQPGDAPRRRRGLRGNASEVRRYDVAPEPEEAPSPVDNRKSRLVRPDWKPVRPTYTDGEVRTVTGRPARRRGLMRLAGNEDEPIPGLPPLPLSDPFLPRAEPDGNPDYEPDDGEEY